MNEDSAVIAAEDAILAAAQKRLIANRAVLRDEQAKERPVVPSAQVMSSAVGSLARGAHMDNATTAAVVAAAKARGVELSGVRGTFSCAGLESCVERVAERRGICSTCIVEQPRRARAERIGKLRETLSPGGMYDFCKPGDKAYVKATTLARAAAMKLDNDHRGPARALIEKAAWKRDAGGVLLLGPTGYGKSKVMVALALRILVAAEDEQSDASMFDFATRIRYVNGIRLARDARAQKLGAVDAAFQDARGASLLLLDEVGFEGTIDPVLVRDLIRDRYEPYRPTILASGATLAELNKRYGEAAIRTIWERGHLIDLHPPEPTDSDGPAVARKDDA